MILDIEFTEVEQSFDANFGEVQIVSDGSGTGENGGYYLPNVSDEGTLSWTPSKDNMPGVKAINIKGEPGKDGYTPIKGVDYFDGAPGEKGDKGDRGEPGKDAEPYTLPTATETTKGGVIIGDGLTIDGDVLSVKSGEYELIETITLTEEMIISRTAEPDGTPYKFDMLWLHINIPPNNTIPAGIIYFYKADNNQWFLHRWMGTTTRTDRSIWNGWVYKHNGQYMYVLPSEWDKDGGSPLWRGESRSNPDALDANSPINRLDINIVMPAGTIITIKGVRADA